MVKKWQSAKIWLILLSAIGSPRVWGASDEVGQAKQRATKFFNDYDQFVINFNALKTESDVLKASLARLERENTTAAAQTQALTAELGTLKQAHAQLASEKTGMAEHVAALTARVAAAAKQAAEQLPAAAVEEGGEETSSAGAQAEMTTLKESNDLLKEKLAAAETQNLETQKRVSGFCQRMSVMTGQALPESILEPLDVLDNQITVLSNLVGEMRISLAATPAQSSMQELLIQLEQIQRLHGPILAFHSLFDPLFKSKGGGHSPYHAWQREQSPESKQALVNAFFDMLPPVSPDLLRYYGEIDATKGTSQSLAKRELKDKITRARRLAEEKASGEWDKYLRYKAAQQAVSTQQKSTQKKSTQKPSK